MHDQSYRRHRHQNEKHKW